MTKVISDIRVYRSRIENIDFNSLPSSFSDKKLNLVIRRIVMRLREHEFTLDDFDHLYINFTTCAVNGGIALSQRSPDRYYPWYRYYDVEVNEETFSRLDQPTSEGLVNGLVEKVLVRFASEQFSEELIHTCVTEATEQGEKMLMRYKEKRTSKNSAVIYLRLLDSGIYFPLLRVFDSEGNILQEEDLPTTEIDLSSIGEIHLSAHKVTVKPRNNVFVKARIVPLEPISFTF